MNLTIHKVKKVKYINSLELYLALGMDYHNYWRWVKKIVTNPVLEEEKDYLKFNRPNSGMTRVPKELLLTISLSKSICVSSRTVLAKKINELIVKDF